jgi:hypothetical protein
MSDFKKLQKFINEYYGQYQDFPYVNSKYSPNETGTDNGKKNTIAPRGRIPTTQPSDKTNLTTSFPATTPVESEEEVRGNIPRIDVINLLKAQMENAAAKNMDYCANVLEQLIDAINEIPAVEEN